MRKDGSWRGRCGIWALSVSSKCASASWWKFGWMTLCPPEEARRQAEEMCRRLLANPVIEEFEVRLDE